MPQPLVSICIPTYNGAAWINEALDSALAQTEGDLEILVVDDASSDHTIEKATATGDPRVRVERHTQNVGAAANWNRCIPAARGRYIKFLFQDDLLSPDCVTEMLRPFRAQDSIGMVFSTREILLADPEDPRSQEWKTLCSKLHHQFDAIGEFNRGRDLFEQYRRKRFGMNFIGEPTCVMVDRTCFEHLGMFNTRMHQGLDFEMWIRILFFYDVGFIDRDLSTFRFHPASTTSANHRANRSWLDMLWLIEGLQRHREIREAYPGLRSQCWREAARIVLRERQRLKMGLRPPLLRQAGELLDYLRYRALDARGRAPDLHGRAG